MWIFRFNQHLRNILRLLTIIFIIVGHYIRNWLTTGPLRKIFDPKGTRRMSRSERLRYIIEDLGPTFIKFGQILADRPDLASESLRSELKKLQTAARPFDDDIAINIIENELGDNINQFIFNNVYSNVIIEGPGSSLQLFKFRSQTFGSKVGSVGQNLSEFDKCRSQIFNNIAQSL